MCDMVDSDLFDAVVESRDVSTFEDFERWLDETGARGNRAAFRGQIDAGWYLATSLERFALSVHVGPHANVREHSSQISVTQHMVEERLTSEFKRGAHHFNVEPLDEKDAFGWLALMQHFGAPTRLLDWTESPYVALYFATETAAVGRMPVVFAVNIDVLELALNERWNSTASPDQRAAIDCLSPFGTGTGSPEERTASLNSYLRKHAGSGATGIVAARPFKMNQRLTLQRGLFLVPLSLEYSFEGQLAAVLGSYPHDKALFRARLTDFDRISILRKLEEMNIHPASLFPGLDGYAQSMKRRYEIHRLHDVI